MNARSSSIDTTVADILAREAQRQEQELTLIASENYASPAVLQATASLFTNKYAEGYPGKRYYAGCRYADELETLAINRVCKLFGAEHANVQPHAGSQANLAVYVAALKPGDTLLGMSLMHGGHLTHGHSVNISGSLYNCVQYSVSQETELIDYDEVERLAHEHKPKLIIAGASAYSRVIDFARFADIARSVGALFMADIAHIAGLVATDLHPSPINHAQFVTSTTHKTLRGPRGGLILTNKEYAQTIDRAIIPGIQGGPFMHAIAAKAVAFEEALQPSFKTYQQLVINNAQTMARAFADLGYRIVSGGTDNHLFIVDLRTKNVTGLQAERALEKAGIIVSRSCIPYDPQKPWITSGIRIGTPAMTTRGMQQAQAQQIVHLIDEVIARHEDDAALARIKQQVLALTKQFPVY